MQQNIIDKPSKGLKLKLNNVLQIYGHLLIMCDSLKLKQVITKRACTIIANMFVSVIQFIKGLKSELNHHTLVLFHFKRNLNHYKSSCSFVIKILQ
jgi:hypothetical protein